MKPEVYNPRLVEAVSQEPAARHTALLALHREALTAYLEAVQRITPEQAAQPVQVEGDPRTLGQIVGHIAAWDRFSTLAAGDILAGVRHPRTITTTLGYIDEDGLVLDFESVDDFNAWAAEQDNQRTWAEIQTSALQMAQTFYTLFTHPDLLSAQRLEQTTLHIKRLGNGMVIEDLPMGWVLWLLQIEHIAISHADELGLQ